MPIVNTFPYNPPHPFKFNHVQTIFPALLRKVENIKYTRERLEMPDGDFLDLDWSKVGSKHLVIVLHGLEGSAERPYIRGMVKMFNQNKYDAIGFNFRGCSGEPNRLIRSYHSGETEDLGFVIDTIARREKYESIVLVGFSLGGNVVLKYVGEQGKKIPALIKKAVGISVPCDLAGCSVTINSWNNFIYLNRFLKSLKTKVKDKIHLCADLDVKALLNSKNFEDFDNLYTAPVHGFDDAHHYWHTCSSSRFLKKIEIPCLIINSKDDSFLSESCYPFELAEEVPQLHLLTPEHGGHVGFVQFGKSGWYWTEERVRDFIILENF